MVAKIVSGQSIRGLLNYNENKVSASQAVLLMANMFGVELSKLDFRSKLNRFQHLTGLNSRVKTNAIHVMLNFDKQDKLNSEKLYSIAATYMDKIGFGDQPYLVYLHKDAHHPHIHLVTTNIQANGKRMSIHNIGKTLSEAARKEIEIEFGLIKAEGKSEAQQVIQALNIEKAIYGETATKRSIANVVTAVLATYKFTSFGEFNAVLGHFGVTADRGTEGSKMFEKRGLVYSVVDSYGSRIGIPFKASAITGKPILKKVEGKFASNEEKRKPFRDLLINRINSVQLRYESVTLQTFKKELAVEGIALVLRRSDTGIIYGLTFIDHRNQAVFNGSALGKSYSAKSLIDFLGNTDKPKFFLKPHSQHFRKNGEVKEASFLAPSNQTNYLDTLLGKTQTDYLPSLPSKKKKRRRGRSL